MKKINEFITRKRTVSILLSILLFTLLGTTLIITIATMAVADSENIFLKGWHAMTNNHEERQIIRLINEKSVDKHITVVAWCQDGKLIATAGGLPASVTIWDSASLSILHHLDQGSRGHGVDNITFSPDGTYLASGLSTVNLWNVADGTLRTTLIAPYITPGTPQDIGIRSLCFSPDGRMLVVVYIGKKQIVIAYRVADAKIVWSYEPQRTIGFPLLTTSLVFTPDGKRVILCTGERGGYDVNLRRLSRVLLLDAESGEFLRSIDDIHVMAPTALALSRDGKWVATGTNTGDWDQSTNEKAHQNVTVDNKDPVRIWYLETGKLFRELPVHSHVQSMAFSKDGKYLFGAKNDFNTHLTLVVWDVESGNMVQEIKNNPGPMNLALSLDGKWLAAACQNKLSIYEIKTDN